MKKAMANITTWLNDLTDLLKALIVFGILAGIIWNDESINIDWPIKNPKISSKDSVLPKIDNISREW